MTPDEVAQLKPGDKVRSKLKPEQIAKVVKYVEDKPFSFQNGLWISNQRGQTLQLSKDSWKDMELVE